MATWFPRGLRPETPEALLILGVPAVLRQLGLAGALTAAHRQIQVTAGVGSGALVHLTDRHDGSAARKRPRRIWPRRYG